MHISVVIPLYRCEPFIEELCSRLTSSLSRINSEFEIILVNDKSPTNDWNIVKNVCKTNNHVKGINLSRNFGQHYAITAGLSYASGEWIVVMDGDLQDLPEEIEKLYLKALEGYEVVLACRKDRQDSFLKRLGSSLFYRTLAYLTETEQNAEVSNFGLYHKKVVHAILEMHDKIKYLPAMVRWVGFNRCEVDVEHAARSEGNSSYSLKKLFGLAINTILSFSDKPLRLTVKLGASISAVSFIAALVTFIRSITGQIVVSGYSSLIISVWLLSGIIITVLGMLGLYIGRTFEQVKNRPIFIVSQTINI